MHINVLKSLCSFFCLTEQRQIMPRVTKISLWEFVSRVPNTVEDEPYKLPPRDFVGRFELKGFFQMVVSAEPTVGLGAKWFGGQPLIERWLNEAMT